MDFYAAMMANMRRADNARWQQEVPVRVVANAPTDVSARTHRVWVKRERRSNLALWRPIQGPRVARRFNRDDLPCRCQRLVAGVRPFCAKHAIVMGEGWQSKEQREVVVSRYKKGMYDHIGYDHLTVPVTRARYYMWANQRMNSARRLASNPRQWVQDRVAGAMRVFGYWMSRSYDRELADRSIEGYVESSSSSEEEESMDTIDDDSDSGGSEAAPAASSEEPAAEPEDDMEEHWEEWDAVLTEAASWAAAAAELAHASAEEDTVEYEWPALPLALDE